MSYFIEAADEIIQDEGVAALTIRKVADRAGYTSATLYNYFDNLNHLIFLATLKHLEEYNNEIALRVAGCKNPVEIYLVISECFCEYSFRDPEIYNLLFYGSIDEKVDAYTRQYYELFENKKDGLPTISKIIGVSNLYRRSLIMLMDCVESGFFSSENAIDFNDIAMLIYRGILRDVLDGKLTAQSATVKNMKYYCQLMRFYIEPEYRDLLDSGYLKAAVDQ
ncbi:MAG: TetR/AcrR family transcriptional regulator [Oscillospiraceae bacterium]|nr:TetR/AcrR family transcriptional regulator [Oscillospiraceae bacterium]